VNITYEINVAANKYPANGTHNYVGPIK